MVKNLFWAATIFVLIGFFPLAYANDNVQMGKAEKETESSQEKGPKVVTYYITIDDGDDRETIIITSTATGTAGWVVSYYDDGETYTVTSVHLSDFNTDEDRESADKIFISVRIIVISGVVIFILVLLIQFILIKAKERTKL